MDIFNYSKLLIINEGQIIINIIFIKIKNPKIYFKMSIQFGRGALPELTDYITSLSYSIITATDIAS